MFSQRAEYLFYSTFIVMPSPYMENMKIYHSEKYITECHELVGAIEEFLIKRGVNYYTPPATPDSRKVDITAFSLLLYKSHEPEEFAAQYEIFCYKGKGKVGQFVVSGGTSNEALDSFLTDLGLEKLDTEKWRRIRSRDPTYRGGRSKRRSTKRRRSTRKN